MDRLNEEEREKTMSDIEQEVKALTEDKRRIFREWTEEITKEITKEITDG